MFPGYGVDGVDRTAKILAFNIETAILCMILLLLNQIEGLGCKWFRLHFSLFLAGVKECGVYFFVCLFVCSHMDCKPSGRLSDVTESAIGEFDSAYFYCPKMRLIPVFILTISENLLSSLNVFFGRCMAWGPAAAVESRQFRFAVAYEGSNWDFAWTFHTNLARISLQETLTAAYPALGFPNIEAVCSPSLCGLKRFFTCFQIGSCATLKSWNLMSTLLIPINIATQE